MDGTQLLAILIRRLNERGEVRISREEVEAAQFGTTHPVLFQMLNDDLVALIVAQIEPNV